MELSEIRKKIDKYDKELVRIIAKRTALIPLVADYKKKNQIKRYQPDREQEIINQKRELAKKYNVNPELIEDLIKRIIQESHRIEKNIMEE